MDFLSAPRGDLIRLVYDLIDQNNALKAQIAELKSRLPGEGSKGKPPLPDFVKPNVKTKEGKKRKERGVGFGRVKSTPTRQVFHSFQSCPDCGSSLGKPSVAYTREIIDIPLPQVEIVEHVVYKRWCTHCGKRYYPQVNFGNDTAGKQRLGVNVSTLVSLLKQEFLQPLGKIQTYLKLVYHLDLSEGALVRLLHTTADMGSAAYEKIKHEIRRSNVVHADETGGREKGKNGYKWNFSNQHHQLLLYRKSRGKQVVSETLGEERDPDAFQGTLVTDFLGSYNQYQGFHQRCWVHYLRDVHELKENNPEDKKLTAWAKHVEDIYREAKSYPGPAPNVPLGVQATQRIEKEEYFKDKLRTLCTPSVTSTSPQSILCARAVHFLPELFTFIRFQGVDADNNRAERALRHSVVQRKISGGTRSARGSETQSILGSLFGTWKLQGLNPLEQTKLLLTGVPCPGV